MRYFANYNELTTTDKSKETGWLEITEAQYKEGIDALMAGREVVVTGGFLTRDPAPTPEHTWEDGEWVAPPAPEPEPPTPEEVSALINNERSRRIEAGKVIDGVYVTGRDEDIRNLTNLALGAQLRMMQGDTSTVTLFRDGNNDIHELTPPQVISLWEKSSTYVSDLYAASWAIKEMDPVPDNVGDDALWPS